MTGGEGGPLSALIEELARAPGDSLLAAWREEPRAGDQVGRFRVVRELGRGGFGAVYEAEDTELGRRVALKALRPRRKGAELSAEWIRREAEAVARLDHPCIVTLHDVGTSEGGPYLVMELLRGRTLSEALAQGPLAARDALRVATEMARGLAHAHGRGILHRDLKPANVFLCEDGRVKLLDFGLAHLLGSGGQEGSGTPGYMAPEQRRGDAVDARADVYAAAVTLQEMVTGSREERAGVPVPRAMARAIEKGTAADREQRPRDGTAWLEELRGAHRALQRPTRAMRVAAAAAAMVALVAGGAYLAWRKGQPAPVVDAGAPSVAVLPFADLSPGRDQEYLSEGIAEEILRALSQVRELKVPGRSSSFWFKGKGVEPAEIGRKLAVTHLLEGSVRSSGGTVRIRAELVKAASGERVWSQTFDREAKEILSVEDEIARAVVKALAPVLLGDSGRSAASRSAASRTENPEAYRLYLLGRYLNGQGTAESFRRSVEALEASIAADPGFAPPRASISAVYANLARARSGEERARLLQASRRSAHEAVEVDPSWPPGLAARGTSRIRDDLDWEGGRADIDRAYALDPEDPYVLTNRALWLSWLGRTGEAAELGRRIATKDPLSYLYAANLVQFLLEDGKPADARAWIRRAQENAPEGVPPGAWLPLGRAALLEGKPEEALASFEKMEGAGRHRWRAEALHALGREAEAREALAALEREAPLLPFSIVEARALLGDVDGAFELLDRVVREKGEGRHLLKKVLQGSPVARDPRFPELLRGMGYPEEAIGPRPR